MEILNKVSYPALDLWAAVMGPPNRVSHKSTSPRYHGPCTFIIPYWCESSIKLERLNQPSIHLEKCGI